MEVRFDEVEFGYGQRSVVRIPRLAIRANRVTAILGPNGAGKTTLLRLVAGLDRPRAGRVTVDGGPPQPRKRAAAFVFQEHVFLRRSLRENLELGLRLRGRRRDDAGAQALGALHSLGIGALADRRADQISGGEARRASLARALCLGAPLLLLDEPLAGLDGKTYAQLLDDLPAVLAESRTATTLLVTHNREEAFRMADDLVVLVDGQVLASGTKQEVGLNPRTREVADVLGYAILAAGDRAVAVPSHSLRVGSGPEPTFVGEVEVVLDLIDTWDVILRVGTVKVHLPLPRSEPAPRHGDRLPLTAERAYDLD